MIEIDKIDTIWKFGSNGKIFCTYSSFIFEMKIYNAPFKFLLVQVIEQYRLFYQLFYYSSF